MSFSLKNTLFAPFLTVVLFAPNSAISSSKPNDNRTKNIHAQLSREEFESISTKSTPSKDLTNDIVYDREPANEAPIEQIRPEVQTSQAPGIKSLLKKDVSKMPAKKVSPASPASNDMDRVQKSLEAGNRKFLSNRPQPKAHQTKAVVLSCSESHVPPELVFGQGVGDISVIRTFGATLDASVIASLEQAVAASDASLLVVLAHTKCEAIKTALTSHPNSGSNSAAIDRAISDIRSRILNTRAPAHETVPFSKNFELEAATSAQATAADLLKQSEMLRERVNAGALRISPALYDSETGAVKFY